MSFAGLRVLQYVNSDRQLTTPASSESPKNKVSQINSTSSYLGRDRVVVDGNNDGDRDFIHFLEQVRLSAVGKENQTPVVCVLKETKLMGKVFCCSCEELTICAGRCVMNENMRIGE